MALSVSLRKGERFTNILTKINFRYGTTRQNQTSSLQIVEEDGDDVVYPPVKPKYPPGKWGQMNPNIAWAKHEDGEKWKSMPTVQERLNYLSTHDTEYGTKLWKYNSFKERPYLSDYQEHTTKTAMIEGIPEIVKDVNIDCDSNSIEVKNALLEKLVEEHDLISHSRLYRNTLNLTRRQNLNSNLIQSLVMTFVPGLSQTYRHLMNCTVDPEVKIEAFWERYGVEAFKPKPDPDKKWRLPERFYQLYAPYQAQSCIACQIRTDKPLPEFVPREDSKCTSFKYSECKYRPSVMGSAFDWVKPKCDPGYVAYDPNQFVNVSFIPRNLELYKLVEKRLGEEHASDLRKYYGMNTAFISTVAQAYNQGFSTNVDVTYPFTTQLIMTDGRIFHFYFYQLNTLHLWKEDEANPLTNICYHQEMSLFDTIENGQIKGLNQETFDTLIKCFALAPVDYGIDLRPALPKDSSDCIQLEEYITKPVEKIEIIEEIVYDLTEN